jgi:hypothetical protein
VHEAQEDGFRCLAQVRASRLRLWSRTGGEWVNRLEELLGLSSVGDVVLDGEVSWLPRTAGPTSSCWPPGCSVPGTLLTPRRSPSSYSTSSSSMVKSSQTSRGRLAARSSKTSTWPPVPAASPDPPRGSTTACCEAQDAAGTPLRADLGCLDQRPESSLCALADRRFSTSAVPAV